MTARYYGAEIDRTYPNGYYRAFVDLGPGYGRTVLADSYAGIRDIIRETRESHGLPVRRRRGE